VENMVPMLILASQSPTRQSLLTKAGVRFSAFPAKIDERLLEIGAVENGADARMVASHLAAQKALAVARLHPGSIVIGADQTLALGDELLHKPADMDAARAQLDHLRGKTHRLHAAIALIEDETLLWSHIETAELTMREFSMQERDEVLALEGAEILASVGGYRLEGPSIRLFEAIVGDYFTILGLPLLPLLAALRLHAPDALIGLKSN
jgi:septum formation protein